MIKGDFRSDNVAGVSAEIMAALAAANTSTMASYGKDAISTAVDARFSALFGRPAKVFPVSTGTAANAPSLAACLRPYGAVYCQEEAHIETSEGGAVVAFSGGGTLMPLRGDGHRLDPEELRAALAGAPRGNPMKPQPDVVTVTQAAEHGVVYRLETLRRIGEVAREAGILFHMDGARFANALATLDCTAAEMTEGVDILSFGATKNGAMNTEAIVVFRPDLVEPLAFRLRRAGQTWSKMRFAATQLLAYVEDDLYLRLARAANGLASRLALGLSAIPGAALMAEVEANIVFAVLPPALIDRLVAEGFLFNRRTPDTIRLVCRFDGRAEEVDALVEAVARLLDRRIQAA